MTKLEFCKIKVVREKSSVYNDLDFSISSTTSAFRLLTNSPICLHESDVECMYCIYLNTRNYINASVHLTAKGQIDECHVSTRDIIKGAILHNANSIIIAHNHPGGYTSPSTADRILTNRVKEACRLFDIRLLDHIIVASKNDYYSFAEGGLV